MFGLGLPELIVIFLVILLLFGAKSLPEVAKGLGQAIRIFKKEANDIKKNIEDDQEKKAEGRDDPGDSKPQEDKKIV